MAMQHACMQHACMWFFEFEHGQELTMLAVGDSSGFPVMRLDLRTVYAETHIRLGRDLESSELHG